MGSQLKLKNANGVTTTIANEDTNTSSIVLNTGELASKSTPVADRAALLARTGIVEGEAVWQTDIGLMYIWTNAQGVDNGGTIINVGTGSWVASYSGAVNVKWFGVIGDGTTADRSRLDDAIDEAEIVGKLVFPKGTYTFDRGIAIPIGVDVDCMNSDIIFLGDGGIYGFYMASNTSIKNINNGYKHVSNALYADAAFITCGLFYGVGNSARAGYSTVIPDIVDANSAVGNWDRPFNIIIENVNSYVKNVTPAANTSFGASFIGLYNFVHRVKINNVSVTGTATYVDKATSWVATDGGVLDNRNYFDAVRFEWGNFVTPAAHASGWSIDISNIYGSGLRCHDHSAVVSMGNAHQFNITNITGNRTGAVFHCGSSGTSEEQAVETSAFVGTNRKVSNIKGQSLYTWTDTIHKIAGVRISGVKGLSNSVDITNVRLTAVADAGQSPTSPGYGIVIGDTSRADAKVQSCNISGAIVSGFDRGILSDSVENITISNSKLFNNSRNGIFIAALTIVANIKSSIIYGNNLGAHADYTAYNGISITCRGANIRNIEGCVFGNADEAAGSSIELHGAYVEGNNTSFKDCDFVNYNSNVSSKDISALSTFSTSAPLLYNCKGFINAMCEDRWTPASADININVNTLDKYSTYSRVGNIVTIQGIIQRDDASTANDTNDLILTGLPIPQNQYDAIFGGFTIYTGSGTRKIGLAYNVVGDSIRFVESGATEYFKVGDLSDTREIRFSFSYKAEI